MIECGHLYGKCSENDSWNPLPMAEPCGHQSGKCSGNASLYNKFLCFRTGLYPFHTIPLHSFQYSFPFHFHFHIL